MSRIPSREEALFADALARSPAERGSFLAQACGADAALLARIAVTHCRARRPLTLREPIKFRTTLDLRTTLTFPSWRVQFPLAAKAHEVFVRHDFSRRFNST